jgi:hypothetical protein
MGVRAGRSLLRIQLELRARQDQGGHSCPGGQEVRREREVHCRLRSLDCEMVWMGKVGGWGEAVEVIFVTHICEGLSAVSYQPSAISGSRE